MKHLLLFVFLVFHGVLAYAQRRGVIISMDTKVPLRNVKIYTNNNINTSTNYRGEFYIPYAFESLTLSHPDYVSLTLANYEMNDTIELLPRFNTLSEVVIWGKSHKMGFDAKRATIDARDYYTPLPGFNFDFFSIFKRKHGLNAEERRKHKEIIENY